ncbi:MAG TPA: YtxH domain-containing protein [Terriglobia bacterium]|jgi:gas vesicle protein
MRGFTKTQVAGFFLTGAAVGAAVALVLAPKSGVQTRRDIRRMSKKARDQFDDLQSDVRDQFTEGYEQMRQAFDNVKGYVEDGKTRLHKIITTA